MNNLKKTYPIVYACDNNFVALLAASIKSLEINSPGSIKEIYIISDGITKRNQHKLIRSITSDEMILKFIDHRKINKNDLKIPYFNNSQLPVTVFYRLFVEAFLPDKTEKVLYLDSDTIVLEDIARLWETNMNEHIIAAVQDISIRTFDCDWGGVTNYKELGYPGDTRYFNSGLLLINFRKWVEFRALEKVLTAAIDNKKHILYGDQYCLNIVLANKWLALDPLWNHLVDYCLIDSSYHPKPFLLHFTGVKPIYTNYTYSEEYRQIFFKYLNLTEWKGIRLTGRLKRKITEIKRVIRKKLTR